MNDDIRTTDNANLGFLGRYGILLVVMGIHAYNESWGYFVFTCLCLAIIVRGDMRYVDSYNLAPWQTKPVFLLWPGLFSSRKS